MNKRETQRFNTLYTKFVQALKLQGYAKKTVESYARGLRRVAQYFDRCPDGRLSKDELKQYFADLLKTHSWSTIKLDRNALQHFWRLILELEWDWVLIVKPPKVKKLPDIISPPEINQLLSHIQKPRYAVLCYVMYTLGLRIGEALNLKVADIDRGRQQVHIRQGKGNKDRLVKLPLTTYLLLRVFWATHRHPVYLFPSTQQHKQNTPMDRGAAQVAIRKAVESAGIKKHITAHSLRHCYATHLIELGLNLRAVQDLLGHEDPRTTAIYTQLTDIVRQDASISINALANKITPPFVSGGQA